jgi:hypothetical protein
MDKIPPPSKLTRQVAMSVFAYNFRGKVKLAKLFPPPSKLTRQVANK